MTDKNTKYLTVKQAAELTGKSESTIKRIVRNSKRNPKHFMFEKLPTGREKIFISKLFLDLHFNGQNSTVNQHSSDRLNEPLENIVIQDLVGYLKNELDKKNEQIAEKDKQIESLLDRNKEINLLFAQAQQREQIKLEESIPKKRWWQRK